MPKSLTRIAAGCIAAAAALTLATAQPQAQEFRGQDHFGPGGPGGHGGPGMMMAQAPSPQGQMGPQGRMGPQGQMGPQSQTGPQGPMGPEGQMMGPGGRPGPARAMARGDGRGDHRSWREQRRARRLARRLDILDTNNDGKVTLAEIEGELKRLTAGADVNGDGKLSADEFRRRGRWFLRLRTVSFFDMLDANGDGQISVAELTGPTGRWFKRQDENNDKALTGEEFNKSDMHHGSRSWRGRRR